MQCELGVGTPGLACIAHRLSALSTHHYDVSLPLIECLFASVFEWLLYACLVNVMNSTHRQHRPTHLYLPGTLQLFLLYIYFIFFCLKEKKYLYVQIRPWSNDKWKNETKCFVILGKKEKKRKEEKKSGILWRPPIIVQTTPDVAWHKWTDTNICFQLAMEAAR